jgi:DNA-directed RNA polymerase subunit beta'
MGHIELAVPVAHIWFFKTLPSPMGNLIDITLRDLEKVIYYSNYVVIDKGAQEVENNQLLDEDEYLEPEDEGEGRGRRRLPRRHRRARGSRAAPPPRRRQDGR